jgi:hypothetical protein
MKLESAKQVIPLLESATCWTWIRPEYRTRYNTTEVGSLMIFHDDVPADLRTIHNVSIKTDGLKVEVRRLSGYDAKKHCWNTDTCRASEYEIEGGRGLKALREHIAKHAVAAKGVPNPIQFSVYATATV